MYCAICVCCEEPIVLHWQEAARTLSFSISIILFLQEGFNENFYTGYKMYSLTSH